MKHISWGVILGLAMLAGSVVALGWASRPFLQQFKGRAFAMSEAEREGFASWPLEAENDYGGAQRYLFRNPTDAGSFNDLTIELKDGRWAVKRLNKDFRPWPTDEQASR